MEVTREVVLEAPLDEVWEALTDPGQVEEWFTEDGEERELVVEEVETRRRVAYTWDEGRVAIEVEEVETGTRVVVTETGEPGLERRLRAPLTRVRPRLSDVLDALGDPTRRHIVESLSRQEASATQLAAELPVTRQAVAKHLTALRDAGIVDSRRQGRETLYRVNTEPLDAAAAWIVRVGGQWDARLERLRGLVEPRRG